MNPVGFIKVYKGGVLTVSEWAALATAVTAVVEEETRAATVDPIPAPYRSAWRSEAIRDALDAGTVR